MKKKILFVISFIGTLFVLLSMPTRSFAATNTFDCKWSGGKCDVGSIDCSDQYEPNGSLCTAVADKSICTSFTGGACIPMTSGGDENLYFCDTNKTSINTAIGCIPVMGQDGQYTFLNFILRWALGIGGGVAFLLIVYSGFMIMTSSGSPERLQAGRELLTSAISGLILLIFSVFILKFIGVDILGLCKFGFGTCPV